MEEICNTVSGCNLDYLSRTGMVDSISKHGHKAKKESTSNTLALIIDCLVRYVPQVSQLQERNFIKLQDEINRIITEKK